MPNRGLSSWGSYIGGRGDSRIARQLKTPAAPNQNGAAVNYLTNWNLLHISD